MKTINLKKDKIKNIARKNDLNHIWAEINESTTGIFLHYSNSKKKEFVYRRFSQLEPYKFDKGLASEEEFREKFPNFVIINPYDYPPNSVDSLKCIPQNLPNLSFLGIKSHEFRSLKGLPKELTNLKKLSIEGSPLEYLSKNSNERKIASKKGSPLSNLKGLPDSLPNLENLYISNSHIANISDLPTKLPSLRSIGIVNSSLKSLNGLPKNFPNLESIIIKNSPIQTLKYIPSSLPQLKRFIVTGCPLRNLRNFPKDVPNLEELNLGGNQLASLEGLPSKFLKLKILNVGSNNLSSLKYFPKNLPDNTRIGIQNNPLRSLCYLNHHSTFQLMFNFKLYKGFDLGLRFEEFINGFLTPYERINVDTGEMETGQKCNIEVIDQVQNYYQKTTSTLIQQYISDSDSISEDELERIIWEVNIEDRNALEANFPSDSIVLQKINHRLKIALTSGHSIFK